MAIEWQKPTIDAAIVVGGAALLEKLVGNVAFINDLLAKLPADVMGASVRLFVLGAVALLITRTYLLK